ncbi:MAG: hypothetical protein H0W12_02650 [Chitinophagaceae bacterium]|nr:hypothetical protein [Chitinophagaceae bacterium]
MLNKVILLCISFLMLVSGCVSTQRVYVFSKIAFAGLNTSDDIKYSFSDYCLQSATLLNYKKVNDNKPIDLFNKPNCAEYVRIDSAKNALFTVVSAYFEALQQLSDDKTIRFNLDGITRYLKKGSYLHIDITDENVKSVNTIAASLLSATVGAWRNNKIKKFIASSDAALYNVISKLEDMYRLLSVSIENQKGDVLDVYTNYMKDTSNKYLQMQSIKDYSGQIAGFDKMEQQIRIYIATMERIKKGHAEITRKINTVSKKEWQKLVMDQSSEIFTLIKTFNAL